MPLRYLTTSEARSNPDRGVVEALAALASDPQWGSRPSSGSSDLHTITPPSHVEAMLIKSEEDPSSGSVPRCLGGPDLTSSTERRIANQPVDHATFSEVPSPEEEIIGTNAQCLTSMSVLTFHGEKDSHHGFLDDSIHRRFQLSGTSSQMLFPFQLTEGCDETTSAKVRCRSKQKTTRGISAKGGYHVTDFSHAEEIVQRLQATFSALQIVGSRGSLFVIVITICHITSVIANPYIVILWFGLR